MSFPSHSSGDRLYRGLMDSGEVRPGLETPGLIDPKGIPAAKDYRSLAIFAAREYAWPMIKTGISSDRIFVDLADLLRAFSACASALAGARRPCVRKWFRKAPIQSGPGVQQRASERSLSWPNI